MAAGDDIVALTEIAQPFGRAPARAAGAAVLSLGPKVAGRPAARLLRSLFGTRLVTLPAASVTDDGPGGLRFCGSGADLFADAAARLVGRLWDAPTAVDKTERRLAFLADLPDGPLDAAAFLASYADSPAAAAALLDGGGAAALTKGVDFAEHRLLFFSGSFAAGAARPPEVAEFFPQPTEARAGLHAKLRLDWSPAFAPLLEALSVKGPATFVASITPDAAGLLLRLVAPLPAEEVFLGPLRFRFSELALEVLAADLGLVHPVVSLSCGAEFGRLSLDMRAYLDLAARRAVLSLTTPLPLPRLADLAEILPLPDSVAGYFPDVGVTLEEMSLQLGFAPLKCQAASARLSTSKRVELLADVISVTPTLSLAVDAPFDKTLRSSRIRLAGSWQFGGSTFDVVLQPAEKLLVAEMAPGQALDVGALFERVLPGAHLPDASIRLMDLELEADWGRDIFEGSIAVATDWRLEIAGAAFSVYDLEMSGASVRRKVTECRLSGCMLVAGLELDASAFFAEGDGWVLRATSLPDGPIRLGLLIERLRHLNGLVPEMARVPVDFSDFAVKNLSLEHRTLGGATTFSCALDHSLTLTDRFSIDTFVVDLLAGASGVTGRCQAKLAIAGTNVVLTASKDETGRWRFEGHTGEGEKAPLGRLLEELAGKFGFPLHLPGAMTALAVSDLAFDFNTETKDASASGTLNLPIGDRVVDLALAVSLLRQPEGAYRETIRVAVGKAHFVFDFTKGQDHDLARATWSMADGQTLGIEDVIGELGLPRIGIPEGLDLSLKAATLLYDAAARRLIVTAASASYGKVTLATWKSASGWSVFFALDTGRGIDLGGLPVLNIIGASGALAIDDIRATAASSAIDRMAVKDFFSKAIDPAYPRPPAEGMARSAGLSLTLKVGGDSFPLTLSTARHDDAGEKGKAAAPAQLGDAGPAESPEAASGARERPSPGTTKWIDIQKSIGPLSLDKIGVRYDDGKLFVLLDAGFSSGGLSLSLLGLGVGSSLSDFNPEPTLDGIDVAFSGGPLLVSGGLLGTIKPVNFTGEMILALPELSIGALGGFAIEDGLPSFFAYVSLARPMGGPPYFFVTGLAAGLGYNRKLVLPPVDQIADFPLVKWAMGSSVPGSGADPGKQVADALGALVGAGVVPVSPGDAWLAAGVRFTSFRLVESFALLTVSLGGEFVVNLLGLSRLALPPRSESPVVLVEFEIKATFDPESGFLGIMGVLSRNSFLLSRDCHLTGGFAYCAWFSGPHEGDFVVTAGGYSPLFTPPDHYPVVPRLGMRWQVSDDLSITGQEYFAVTSSAVMAGGSLSAVWSSGGIDAWFNLEADFLMVYVPFHYHLSASCQLGASFSIDLLFTSVTITIHLGVGIEIWGPEFTGRATVDLSIISFTISFGASEPEAARHIEWETFVQTLLPSERAVALPGTSRSASPPASILQIEVAQGLLRRLSDAEDAINWVVDGRTFEMTVTAAIPFKELGPYAPDRAFEGVFHGIVEPAPHDLQPGVDGRPATPETAFGVGPCGIPDDEFWPTLQISATSVPDRPYKLRAIRILKNAPKSLWETRGFDEHGVPQGVDAVGRTTIPNVQMGWRLLPPKIEVPANVLVEREILLFTEDQHVQAFAWSAPTTPPSGGEDAPAARTPGLAEVNRGALAEALRSAGFASLASVDLNRVDPAPLDRLFARPTLRPLGAAE
jgi:hypothetical protein